MSSIFSQVFFPAIVINSGGAINGRSGVDSHLTVTSPNGKVTVTAATGIGDPLVVDAPWPTASTVDGDINIVSR